MSLSKSKERNDATLNSTHHRSKTIENDSSPNKCLDNKVYLNPQLISKSKVGINTSTALQMYSFGKAQRFKPIKRPWDALFYNLPSVQDKFTTTFGYGTKLDLYKNAFKGKTHAIYDIPKEFELFRHNTPQYSFGKGRDDCKRPELEIKKNTPGVGTYNLRTPPGKDALKFSIFGRDWANPKNKSLRTLNPGPGTYEDTLRINRPGKYCTSLYNNTRQIAFAGPERFKTMYNRNPAPGAYDLPTMFNRTGFHFTSKFDSKIGKTMSNRPSSFYRKNKMSMTPGPGSYNIFSEFEGFTGAKRLCKCGRELGHSKERCNSRKSSKFTVCKRHYKTISNTISIPKIRKSKKIARAGREKDYPTISKNTDGFGYNTITSDGAYKTTKNDTI